jgi:hypothetical protein
MNASNLFGHLYGQKSPRQLDIFLKNLPHDIQDLWDIRSIIPSDLFDLATKLRKAQLVNSSQINLKTLKSLGNVLLGPKQYELISYLSDLGFDLEIDAGYRSATFQAMIYAARHLDGTLYDEWGRLTVALPYESDHQKVDFALDIRNSSEFYAFCINNKINMPGSLLRPYLASKKIAYEPWHWRCLWNSSKFSRLNLIPITPFTMFSGTVTHNRLAKAVVEAMAEKPIVLKNLSEHPLAFLEDVQRVGGTGCVGSRANEIVEAVNDALNAVMGFDSLSYLTVIHGFNPSYDGRIAEAELGHCTIGLIGTDGKTAYLTPYAIIRNSLISEEAVQSKLELKADLQKDAPYHIIKSEVLEALIDKDELVSFAASARPYPNLERACDAPDLLQSDFLDWIETFIPGIPPYFYRPSDGSSIQKLSPTHLAYCASELIKYVNERPKIKISLNKWRQTLYEWMRQDDGVNSSISACDIPSVAVFYLQFLISDGDSDLAISELERYENLITAGIGQLDTKESCNVYLAGHYCNFLNSLAIITKDDRYLCDRFHKLEKECNLLNAMQCNWEDSASAAISFIFRIALRLGKAPALKGHNLLVALLLRPSSILPQEEGAFVGSENFQTALLLEAMTTYAACLPLSAQETEIIEQRILSGLIFLRNLQFPFGSNATLDTRINIEGTFPFSFADQHMRIDYGFHALNVSNIYLKCWHGKT